MKETSSNVFDRLFENVHEFIELKMQYYKLVAYEKAAFMVSMLISVILMMLFFLVCYFFLMIALGFVLVEIFDSYIWGFAVIAAVNLLLAVLFVVLRKQLIMNPLINATVRLITKKDRDEP